MKILVTGGAGYIGSFMVKRLLQDGHEVTVADSMEKGYASALDPKAMLKKGDLCDRTFVKTLFADTHFDGVIHFAAYISMGESMENPYIYFQNNILASLHIIEEMRNNDINNFIFSSTAGVYGNPTQVPIPEDHTKNPENPYGESKLMVEKILGWYAKTRGLHFVCLRYFNAAGAAVDGSMGENHNPETHIIPNILRAAKANVPFTLYGNDYQTPDGTCVRDYIHVLDLAQAHMLALQKLHREPGAYYYNVGTGKGHSNKEVVNAIKKLTGIDFAVTYGERRPGDADTLVADVSKIQQELQFTPMYSDLQTIVTTAWAWANHRTDSKE